MTLLPLPVVHRTGRARGERNFTVNDHKNFRFPNFSDNERIVCVIIFPIIIIIIIITIIIIIIIIITTTTIMQGIHNYIPETNHIYSVTAVLYLQLVLHVMLFRMLNMFYTFTLALPAVCVQCPVWLFSVVS